MATKSPVTPRKKVYRSNLQQAPENLPSRAESIKNGTLNPDAPLTERQRQFVLNIVEHGMSQTAAARTAGFANCAVAATQMMSHPKIQRAIAERRAEYAAASQMTKQRVIDGFLEAVNMARTISDPNTMVSGWREIGKMCGYYEPTRTKIDLTVNGKIMHSQIATMTDEELLRLAEEHSDETLNGEIRVIEDE